MKLLGLYKAKIIVLFFAASALLSACSGDNGDTNKVNFDREAMLVHWYDNLMVPAFSEFAHSTHTLKDAFEQFEANPNPATLQPVQARFLEAYHNFQRIKCFETGPSASLSLRANLNTYPVDTAQVESMVVSGTFNGGAANQLDAQAFPAMDYLLFSSSVDLISSSEHRTLLAQNTNFIHDLAHLAESQWLNFRSTFIKANGTDVSSSLGQIVNALNQDYEHIKNAKIGFPAGKKTFGTPYPKACEGYYAGQSVSLADANLEAIHNFYRGTSTLNSSVGTSLYDNLLALNTKAEGMLLADLIDLQFEDALEKLNAIPGTLSNAVVSNTAKVDAAYSAIQLNIIYLKTDLPSALGVIITYQDNDGD